MSEPALLEALRAATGEDAVRTDAESLAQAASDLHIERSRPAAVVRPTGAEAVATTIAAATSRGHAVLLHCGGLIYTGGHARPAAKAVKIDLGGLNRIVAIAEDYVIAAA